MSPDEEFRMLQRVEDALRTPDPHCAPEADPSQVDVAEDQTEWVGLVALLVWTFAVGGGAFLAGAAWRGAQIVGG